MTLFFDHLLLMNTKKKIEIPVIPVRNEVIFPRLQLPLSIFRKASKLALEESFKQKEQERTVLIVTQKKQTQEDQDPEPEQIYSIGCLVKIDEFQLNEEQPLWKLSVSGLERFRIDRVFRKDNEDGESYLVAVGEVVPERYSDAADEEIEAKTRSLLTSVKDQMIEFNETNPIDLLEMVVNSYNKSMSNSDLSNLMAFSLPILLNQKQKLLETSEIDKRAEMMHEILAKEISNNKIRSDVLKKTSDEIKRNQREYFLKEQMRAIKKELGEDEAPTRSSAEMTKKVKDTKLPAEVKKAAEEELRRLEQLHPSSSEYQVVRNYLDWLVSLPWYKSSKDNIDLTNARKILDEEHYGLEKVKKRILEFLAVAKFKNTLKGSIICLVGPPGVGKTSLGRSIARAVGRNFGRMSLGGVRDEAEIRGHRRTYVGAMPGKIVQTLKRIGTNNPVLVLDEIDKLGKNSNQGDPSAAMLEVLDPEQNHTFQDHYLDVPVDLSGVLFIATANVLEDIPVALRDRMEIIYLSGYTLAEKFHIAKKHLVPKQIKDHGLENKNVVFTDEALNKIILSYTRESGVRELQRIVASVCRYVAQTMLSKELESFEVKEKDIVAALGIERFTFDKAAEKEKYPGLITGMAWTQSGGDILFIESSMMPGRGKFIVTGQIGDVMKESSQIALSYLRANKKALNISENIEEMDFHIHLPAGAIPKDGPSAGIALLSSLVSLLKKKPVDGKISMTGELSLRGKVLPVGGIKEKVIAAHRAGIKEIILPKANKSHAEEIPEEVRKDLKINFVENVSEVIKLLGLE